MSTRAISWTRPSSRSPRARRRYDPEAHPDFRAFVCSVIRSIWLHEVAATARRTRERDPEREPDDVPVSAANPEALIGMKEEEARYEAMLAKVRESLADDPLGVAIVDAADGEIESVRSQAIRLGAKKGDVERARRRVRYAIERVTRRRKEASS